MKARVYYTSDFDVDTGDIVEFNSLEQLLDFVKESNRECILTNRLYSEKFKDVCDFGLEIYNDYRE